MDNNRNKYYSIFPESCYLKYTIYIVESTITKFKHELYVFTR